MALAIDASTPAAVYSDSATSVTTASFTPPSGATLVAFGAQQGTVANQFSITSSNGLTWIQKAYRTVGTVAVYIWTATVSASAAMTVSISHPASVRMGLDVLVLTGAEALPQGVVVTWAGGQNPSADLVTTRANSWVFAVSSGYDTSSTAVAVGSGQTLISTGTAGATESFKRTFWRQTTTTSAIGTTVTMNQTAPTYADNAAVSMAAIEIRTPAAGAEARTVQSARVTVEFVSGTQTDISAFVAAEYGMQGTFGRQTRFDDAGPSTWTLTLRNSDGRFTPGNTSSPYSPNVVRGKYLRVWVTAPNGIEYQRFSGFIDDWTISFPNNDVNACIVTVKASDVLARYGRKTLEIPLVEEARRIARAASAGCDVFPFKQSDIKSDSASTANSTTFENKGVLAAGNSSLGTITVIPSTVLGTAGSPGSVTSESADSDLNIDRLTFTPVYNPAGDWWTGPTLSYVPQGSFQQIEFFVKIPDDFFVPTGVNYDRTIMDFVSGGVSQFELRVAMVNGTMRMLLRNSVSGVGLFVGGGDMTDGQWRKIAIYKSAASQVGVSINDVTFSGAYAIPSDITTINQVVIGGWWDGGLGLQGRCIPMSFAGLDVQTTTTGVFGYITLGAPPAVSGGSSSRLAELIAYDPSTSPGTPTTTSGVTTYSVVRTPTTGRTLLDCLQELGRSDNGFVYVSPSGTAVIARQDAPFILTSVAAITLESDDDGGSPITWRDGIDVNPTRATVTCPSGTGTYINTTAESAGAFKDLQINTCNASVTDALTVAKSYVGASVALTASQISVDLVTAQTNLWAQFLGVLRPGARMSVNGVPSAIFGVSSKDVYAEGWTETFLPDSVVFTFDTSPAV